MLKSWEPHPAVDFVFQYPNLNSVKARQTGLESHWGGLDRFITKKVNFECLEMGTTLQSMGPVPFKRWNMEVLGFGASAKEASVRWWQEVPIL